MACRQYVGATACEFNNNDNQCNIHTENGAKESGSSSFSCFVLGTKEDKTGNSHTKILLIFVGIVVIICLLCIQEKSLTLILEYRFNMLTLFGLYLLYLRDFIKSPSTLYRPSFTYVAENNWKHFLGYICFRPD